MNKPEGLRNICLLGKKMFLLVILNPLYYSFGLPSTGSK